MEIQIQDKKFTKKDISNFENLLMSFPQEEIKPKHYFCNGIYARELFIPKGTVLVGKIHSSEHINVISKGLIDVITEEDGYKTISAPHTMVCPPGVKRAGYALEDTIWTTFHSNETNEKDLDKLEELFIIPEREILEFKQKNFKLKEGV